MTDMPNRPKTEDAALTTRRQMLVKLGLAAGAIYAAPVLVNLSEARASGGSYGSYASYGSGNGRRRRRGRGRGSFSGAS